LFRLCFLFWGFLEAPRGAGPDGRRGQGQGGPVQHVGQEGPVPGQRLPRLGHGVGHRGQPHRHRRLRLGQDEVTQALLRRPSLHLHREGPEDQVHPLHWPDGQAQGRQDEGRVVMLLGIFVQTAIPIFLILCFVSLSMCVCILYIP